MIASSDDFNNCHRGQSLAKKGRYGVNGLCSARRVHLEP